MLSGIWCKSTPYEPFYILKYHSTSLMILIGLYLGPIGAPGDPLADPFDDPSYSFSFRSAEHQRREDADSAGRVRGIAFPSVYLTNVT